MKELEQELSELRKLKERVKLCGGSPIQIFSKSLNEFLAENEISEQMRNEINSILKDNAPSVNRFTNERGGEIISRPTTCINWEAHGFNQKVIAKAIRAMGGIARKLDGRTHYTLRIS